MILKLIGMFFGPWGTPLMAGGALLVVFVAWQADRAGQRSVGRQQNAQQVESNNAEVQKSAASAARKSRDPAARGVLNPYYRVD